MWQQTIDNFEVLKENKLFSFNIKQLTNLFNMKIERFYDFLTISYEGDRESEEEGDKLTYEQFENFRKKLLVIKGTMKLHAIKLD